MIILNKPCLTLRQKKKKLFLKATPLHYQAEPTAGTQKALGGVGSLRTCEKTSCLQSLLAGALLTE